MARRRAEPPLREDVGPENEETGACRCVCEHVCVYHVSVYEYVYEYV
jgi:hypothetical protein